MRRLMLLTLVISAVFCSSSALWAYTLTFDDVSLGKDLSQYYQEYGFGTPYGWEVVDSVASGWGIPHSGMQVAVWNGVPEWATGFGFGVDGVSEYTVCSVSAYFTTAPGVVVEMQGYSSGGGVVSTARIGDAGSPWINGFAEIHSTTSDIAFVHIVRISSPDARYHFSLDDLTIVPVPEPSSFIVLTGGLASLLALRRRPGK